MNTKLKKLKKLAEKYSTGEPPTGDEFTVAEWANESGMSLSYASKELDKMVGMGVLTRRMGRVNNKSGKIYNHV